MGIVRRALVVATGAVAGLVLTAGPALADNCTNASKKDADSGAQVVFGANDEVLFISRVDVDGDGVADASTWIGVGPDGHELPIEAQFRGPACRGITNLGICFEQCVGV